MKTDFILGAATGYTQEQLENFLNSIHQAQFLGTVVLFIHQAQFNTITQYSNKQNYCFKLNLITTNIGLKKMRKYRKLARYLLNPIASMSSNIREKLIHKLAYPHVSRFFDYYYYLQNRTDIQNVMLTDTRDVIMQKNPFSTELNGLFLGIEDHRTPMELDKYSKRWICDVYGEDFFNSIMHHPISCAGVTIGDYSSILSYLKTMIDEFLKLPFSIMLKSNYDQGIHNKLLYSEQFQNVKKCQPQVDIISTLGLVPFDELLFDEQGNIFNKDGTLSSIIHQYDRHPQLDILINHKYGAK